MNTALIKLTLVLLLGICTGFYLQPSLKASMIILIAAFLVFIFAWLRSRKQLFPDIFFGSAAFSLFFSLGISVVAFHLPQNQQKHFSNFASEGIDPLLILRIVDVLKPDLYNEKYVSQVESIDGVPSAGKILLLRPLDSTAPPFKIGSRIATASQPAPVPSPLNPYQFDYSKFMLNKGITGEIRLLKRKYLELKPTEKELLSQPENLRKLIKKRLQQRDFEDEELAVVQALLLGQKQDISPETYNNFAAAGAIHILAVSGLHVGIILLMLQYLFAPFEHFKRGRTIKTLLVILSLWLFAILAGLSPSVVRAVTMFSFIAAGMSIRRRTSTLNSVFLSLLLLLLINPRWIFEVGFQLSYLAVLSIILIRPLLQKLYRPRNAAAKFVWGLLSVSIAAQAGVLPVSLYYFHQFPGLFFISNLIILPALGLILMMGFGVILLALMEILPEFIARTYEHLIGLLILIVKKIAEQEAFIFKDVAFDLSEMWGFYLLICALILLSISYTYKKLLFMLVSVISLQCLYIFKKSQPAEELIVFHKSRSTIIGAAENRSFVLYHNNSDPIENLGPVKNYMIGRNLKVVQNKPLKNAFRFKDKPVIVIDKSGIHPTDQETSPIVLLTDSPPINLDRMLFELKPEMIIADGSNYRSFVEQWKRTSRSKDVPFHDTAINGAFILK